ncbi:hypothetical protein [Leeuwenhoekiella sp. NPDC079379]|uniref:hypothetical protein n=1 Tax=Leeuwenhoekiella sp. NPDC079379 TaxID=3364122 RepID=UPI0037C54721
MSFLKSINSRDRIYFILFVTLAILVNLTVIAYMDLETSRLIRLITVFIFFIYYTLNRGFLNIWMLSVLAFFFVKDVFFQFYEEAWGYKLYLIFGTLGYLTIVLERLPKLSEIKFKPGIVLITTILVAANTYTLYIIMNMVSYTFHDGVEPVLLYLYGASMMLLGVEAIAYNNKYNSTRSLIYTFFAFGFVFSDIAALFAYYFGFEIFYYFDRFLFLSALGMYVHYSLNYESIREEYFQYEMIDKKL